MKNYVQEGKRITWTNGGSAVTSGAIVVIGNLVGVATTDIAAGATGEVAIEGVFNLAKLDAAVIAQGETVALDVSAASGAGEVDDNNITPASGDITNFGIAMEGKGATSGETIAVRLSPGSGVVN